MPTNLSTRLTVEGVAEIVTSARDAGQIWAASGKVSEAALQKAIDKAEGLKGLYSQLAQAAEKVAEQDRARAQANSRNEAYGLASGVRNPADVKSASDSAEVFQAYERQRSAADALRGALDPLFVAQSRYDAEVANYRELLDQGLLSQQEFAQAVDKSSTSLTVQRTQIELTQRAIDGMVASLRSADSAEAAAYQERLNGTLLAQPLARPKSYADDYARLLADQDREAHALLVSLNPMVAAQERYNAAIEQANRLKPQLGIELYDQAIKKATADLKAFEASQASNRGSQLQGYQLTNLSYQLNDVITGLATGQPIMMVFMQQAGQIAQVFQGPGGGLTKVMQDAVAFAISPYGIALGAATAVTATAIGVTMAYAASQDHLALALMAVGNASGLTVHDLEALAEQQGKVGGISVSSARDIEAALLRAGVSSKATIGGVIADVRAYSLVAGTDLKTANETLARAMADPAGAGEALLKSLRQLDGPTTQQIEHFTRLGDVQDAQRLILQGLNSALDGTKPHISAVTELVTGLGNAWSNAADAAGRYIDKHISNQPQDIVDRYKSQGPFDPWTILTGFGNEGRLGNNLISNDQYQDALKQLADQKKTNDAKAKAASDALISSKGLEAKNALDPTDEIRKKLADDLVNAKAAHDNIVSGVRAMSDADFAAAQKGYDRQMAQLNKRDNPGQGREESLARQLAAMQVSTTASYALADAYLKSDGAALKAQASRDALTDATKKGADIESWTSAKIAEMVSQQGVNAAQQIAQLGGRTAAEKKLTDAVMSGALPFSQQQAQLQQLMALRPIEAAMSLAQGEAYKKLAGYAEQMAAAMREGQQAEAAMALAGQADANGDRIERLKLELSLVAATNTQREHALALFDAQKKIADSGLGLNDPSALALYTSAGSASDAQSLLAQAQYMDRLARDQSDRISMLVTEHGLVAATSDERERQLALQQQMLALAREGIDPFSQQAQYLRDQLATMQQMEEVLKRQEAYHAEIAGLGQKAYESITDLLAKGDFETAHWANAAKEDVQEVIAEVMKLALFNPLENRAFGTNKATFADSGESTASGVVTSFFANLLGGGQPRASQTLARPYQDFTLDALPSFAKGVDDFPGGFAKVHRDEVLALPRGTTVNTAARSRELFANMKAAARPSVIAPAGPTQVKFDLGGAIGPVADFMNGIEGRMNDGFQAVHDQTMDAYRRSLPGDLENLHLLGA